MLKTNQRTFEPAIQENPKEFDVNETISQRLKQIRKIIAENEIDTFMVLVGENRHYLSGFSAEDTQFDESAGALFITPTKLLLATDSRYLLEAKKDAPLFETYCYKEGLIRALPEILALTETRCLGFESVRLTYLQHRSLVEMIDNSPLNINLLGTENLVEKLRKVKSEAEIGAVKAALKIAEAAFVDLCQQIRPGMSEKEAAWELEKRMRERGADGLSFPVIVASGPNSALPHAVPGERRFKVGEPILFDWGTRLNGYCSDISRTICIGQPDEIFVNVYRTVHEAQNMSLAAIKADADAQAIDAIARTHIDEKGYKERFGHGLGHGVGLAIHEAPRLGPTSKDTLLSGMIVTVEPGIYLPDWGGVRLENMVAVRQDGSEVLNGHKCGDGIISL